LEFMQWRQAEQQDGYLALLIKRFRNYIHVRKIENLDFVIYHIRFSLNAEYMSPTVI